MAFQIDDTHWNDFLKSWPIDRLRTMTLPEYTAAGDKDCFTYWIESRLAEYGSIWGGSAFKFGIYARGDTTQKPGDDALAYDAKYGWYRKFGDTSEAAFEGVRRNVLAVAEAANAGRLEEIDESPLGTVYRWKIAFHYQPRQSPLIVGIFVRKALLRELHLPPSDTTTPQSALYRAIADHRKPEESILAFGERVWKVWLRSTPYEIKLSAGAIKHGYLTINLGSAPFPESMYGGNTDAQAGELAHFVTDTNEAFDSDIRVTGAGGSGRLRKRLYTYFGQIGAKVGDIIQVAQEADGRYQISAKERVGAISSGMDTPAPAPKPNLGDTRRPIAMPLNQILFGPPGTGKTYGTIIKALEILDPDFLAEHDDPEERTLLKQRFDELSKEGMIQFVTFHQSFSYEDFVEGVRAEADETTGQLRYEVADGVFKRICDAARSRVVRESATSLDLNGRHIWKLSLGDSATEGHIFEECIQKGMALMGFGLNIDFSKCSSREQIQLAFKAAGNDIGLHDYPVTAINTFVRKMRVGDLLVVSEGNLKFRAIGEIVGEYRRIERDDDTYAQCRNVSWLRVYNPALPVEALMEVRFSQTTTYELRPGSINLEKLHVLLNDHHSDSTVAKARVLIVDEINRGNVSRIFGELITLLEPSKRTGAAEALETVLPYSKQRFSVPNNVYLIGTMNTADRSLSGLDIALRRRFEFIEMPPRPELLAGVVVAGVNIQALLETMNRRIEVLLDRDHMLGHSYFMSLENGQGIGVLASIFRKQVLPLLQEYFFEDWQRIHWVLNDHRKGAGHCFVVPHTQGAESLFGKADVPTDVRLWRLDQAAFEHAESYIGIVDGAQA